MCELCHRHGEGGKWFLQAKNYADDLLSDLRRRDYVQRFMRGQRAQIGAPEAMAGYARLPWPLKPVVRRVIEHRLRHDHFGQVVTPAEAREILALVNNVVRLPCVCRRITLGGEHRYCLGFSMLPGGLGAAGLADPSYWSGPGGTGLERLTREEALALLAGFEREDLVHSVWTFKTPYIGGLCNCDAEGCRAMRGNLRFGLTVLHPGESVAAVNEKACRGCGICLRRCPFGAIHLDTELGVAAVAAERCYGCGLCLTECPWRAVSMRSRSAETREDANLGAED